MDVTVTFLTGGRQNQVETLRSFPARLGRSDECQVRFDPEHDRRVSAVHAELRKNDEGGLEIVDLDSKNGLFLDGVRVEGSALVPDHAVVTFGDEGPRLRLDFEQGGGISFARVRSDTQRKLDKGRVQARHLATTDEAVPVYDELDLERRSRASLGDNKPFMIAVFLVLVALGLIALGFVFI